MQKEKVMVFPYIGETKKGGKAMTKKNNIIDREELKKVLGGQEDFTIFFLNLTYTTKIKLVKHKI